MTDYYDRDGNPMPDNWWDRKKRGDSNAIAWRTERRVARTVVGDIIVSTVWLGLNHGYLSHDGPLIFETMTFGDPWANEMKRYSTEEDAMIGHLIAVSRLRAGKPPFAYLDDSDADCNE